MNNEVASLMNNEKLMKIFDKAKINRNYSLFTIHYSFLIFRTFRRCLLYILTDFNWIYHKKYAILPICKTE